MPLARREDKRYYESADSGKSMFVLKKINLRALLEEAIEKAKGIDHNKIEREIEEESNRLAKKRFVVLNGTDKNHKF